MELMEKKVKDKKLLNALQQQYIIVDDYNTFQKLTKDPTFTILKNIFRRKKSKKSR